MAQRPQPADRTAVESVWTTLLASAIADSEHWPTFAPNSGKTDQLLTRSPRWGPPRRPVDTGAIAVGIRWIHRVWTTCGRDVAAGGLDPRRLAGRAGGGGEATGVGRTR